MRKQVSIFLFAVAAQLLVSSSGYGADEALEFFLRTGVLEEKRVYLEEHMHLTMEQEHSFWPTYTSYLADIHKAYDERFMLIKQFGENYESMNDREAKEIFDKALIIQDRITQVKREYYSFFKRALGSDVMVLRFYQIDRRMEIVTDLRMTNELPLINTPRGLDQERIDRDKEKISNIIFE